MATTMTLAQLRSACKQRADMENSGFISDTEWTSYINQSLFELYDLLIQKFGNDYYVASPYSFSTDGTSQFISLPADFYKLMGVDVSLGGNAWASLKPFSFAERNRYSVPGQVLAGYGPLNIQYRLNGSNLMLMPQPSAGLQMRIWYVPRLTPLALETDSTDGISGWTEYVICDCAIKALQKQEQDVSVLMAQKQGLIQRIESAAENRDAGAPMTVSDTVSGMNSGVPWWFL